MAKCTCGVGLVSFGEYLGVKKRPIPNCGDAVFITVSTVIMSICCSHLLFSVFATLLEEVQGVSQG